METPVITSTLPEQGVPEGTGSQATEPAPQGVEQPQSANGAGQVEPSQQQPSSQPTERPSDFYAARERQKLKLQKLEQENKRLRDEFEAFKQNSSAAAQPPKAEPKKVGFWENPDQYHEQIDAQFKTLEERIEQKAKEILEKGVPQVLTQTKEQQTFEQNKQEALEMIFPKTDPNSKLTLEERMNSNPERLKKIDEIWKEHGLHYLAEKDPKAASRIALKLLGETQPKPEAPKNPFAPKKEQMASTGTNLKGGMKTMPDIQEIQNQFQGLMKQLGEKPALRFDDGFMQKMNVLEQQLTSLPKTEGQ